MNENSRVVEIGGVYVSEEVLTVFFACDLSQCKGVCCTTPSASIGAPISEQEKNLLETHKSSLLAVLPSRNKSYLAENGLYEKQDIRFFTPSLDNTAQCAFALQEQACWQCSIQKHKAQIGINKPISCSLFPVRELVANDLKPLLVLEYWEECETAYPNGETQDVVVYEAVKDALIQRFGEAFYRALDEFAQSGQLDTDE